MFKLTVKSLLARKLRLALTSFAIVIGVSFIVSRFVIADTLRATFDHLGNDLQENLDLTVRANQDFGGEEARPLVSQDVLSQVQQVDGVAQAGGNINVFNTAPVKSDGKAVSSTFGPPLIGTNYTGIPEL